MKAARTGADESAAPAGEQAGPANSGPVPAAANSDERRRENIPNEQEDTKAMPTGTEDPDGRTIYRLFLKTGQPPKIVYDAAQELRNLARNNIVAALQAHAAEIGSKLDAFKAVTEAKFDAINGKIDAQKAKTDARFDAQQAKMEAGFADVRAEISANNKKLDTVLSEMGTLRTMLMVTLSFLAVLTSLIGVLGGLGIYRQHPAPAASAPAAAASPAPVADREPGPEATAAVQPSPAAAPR